MIAPKGLVNFKRAEKRFFRKLLKGLTYIPRVIVTEKLKSYGAAKPEILPSVEHRQPRSLNIERGTRTNQRISESDPCNGLNPRATPSVFSGLWSHLPTFPPATPSVCCSCLSSRAEDQIPDLAGNHGHGIGRIRDEREALLPLLSFMPGSASTS